MTQAKKKKNPVTRGNAFIYLECRLTDDVVSLNTERILKVSPLTYM